MNNEPVMWTMRNGQQIDVDQMSIEHLRNTLKMLIRNSEALRQMERECNGHLNYLSDKDEDGFDAQGEDIYGHYK